MFSSQNVPKTGPSVVSAGQIPCSHRKIMITMRILIVQNVWDSEGFVSGGVWDGENFGLKAKKKPHKRTPQKCPKGPAEDKLGESASHQIIDEKSMYNHERSPKQHRMKIEKSSFSSWHEMRKDSSRTLSHGLNINNIWLCLLFDLIWHDFYWFFMFFYLKCAKNESKSRRVSIDPVLPQKNNDYHANPHNPKRLV